MERKRAEGNVREEEEREGKVREGKGMNGKAGKREEGREDIKSLCPKKFQLKVVPMLTKNNLTSIENVACSPKTQYVFPGDEIIRLLQAIHSH